ncbi:ankycorbin [Rhinophrynus dorsalis]
MKSLKAKFRKSDTNEWNKNDERLLQAVDHGEVDKVASLLGKKGVVATKMDSEGKTAFHLAAMKGNADCLRLMLTHGVDVSAQDLQGHSALHLAVKNNHLECVKRLLQAKCPVECTDNAGKSSMHYAAANGCLPAVQLLYEQKCPIHNKDVDGNTPLLIAAQHGHTDVSKYLLDHKADINFRDKDGRTPLILACESGNVSMVDMLVRRGADIRLTDALGHDALHYSRITGNSQIINLLLSKMSQEPGTTTPTKPIQHDQVTKLSSERSGTPKKRKAPPPPPISPLQLSDMSSPLSSTSSPHSAKGTVFFPEQTSQDENLPYQRDYKDRLSDSTADSLLDVSTEGDPQETLLLLQAKVASLTLLNKELQEKLQAKTNNEEAMDISCDSYHSTQTELNVSVAKAQEQTSHAVVSENSDLSFESQPEISISELKLKQLEKTIEDLQLKLDLSEAERENLEAQIQSLTSDFGQSVSEEASSDPLDLQLQLQGAGDESHREIDDVQQKPNLQRMSQVDTDEPENIRDEVKLSEERLLMIEEFEELKRKYQDVLAENELKEHEIKELQNDLDIMTENMANMVSLERQEDMEKSYCAVIEKISQENAELSDKYLEELEEVKRLKKELESQNEWVPSDEDGQVKEDMTKTIAELNKQVSELSLLYNEAQAELDKKREASQDLSCDFIPKDEHEKVVQEIKDCKEKVEKDIVNLESQYAKAVEEMCQLKQRLEEEKGNSPVIAEHMQVIASLKNTISDIEAERNELRECLVNQESRVKSLQEELLHEKSIVQEKMVTRTSFEELQASLEEEISTLSTELERLLKEKERLSMDNAQVKRELAQLKGDKETVQSQLKAKEQEIHEFSLKYDKAQEDLSEMKRLSEMTSKLEEEKDKKINELSKEVSKLKDALNSLSQLSFSTSTPKRQSQQMDALQQQVKQLQNQLAETKKQHQETVSVYRMHLLYAVQGQMDEDVQKVLKQILTMCKSQPQKM